MFSCAASRFSPIEYSINLIDSEYSLFSIPSFCIIPAFFTSCSCWSSFISRKSEKVSFKVPPILFASSADIPYLRSDLSVLVKTLFNLLPYSTPYPFFVSANIWFAVVIRSKLLLITAEASWVGFRIEAVNPAPMPNISSPIPPLKLFTLLKKEVNSLFPNPIEDANLLPASAPISRAGFISFAFFTNSFVFRFASSSSLE